MSAGLRNSPLRRLLSVSRRSAPFGQRRWAQVHDVRFLATHRPQERITARYHDKLDRKAKQEGHDDISTLKEAYRDKIEAFRKKAAVPGATAPLNTPTPISDPSPPHRSPSSTSSPLSPAPTTTTTTNNKDDAKSSSNPPGIKTLSSFLDIQKTLELPQKEIQAIWRLRHAHKPDGLHFTLPAHTHEELVGTARQHPQFVLPLPRPGASPDSTTSTSQQEGRDTTDGAAATTSEMHFLQWTFPAPDTTVLIFTHLAEYKLRGEFATPHTTITFHAELAGPKGLVLGQGVVTRERGVTVDEARWLLMCVQKFYGVQRRPAGDDGPGAAWSSKAGETGRRDRRRELLEMFSRGDEAFNVDELVEEADKIT